MITLRDLFSGPSFDAARLATVEKALAADERTHTPWYIQGLIAFGAWLASIFLLFFVCLLLEPSFLGTQHLGIGLVGGFILITTVVARHFVSGLFAGQCCLAFSFAGQGMILFGALPDTGTLGAAVLVTCALALILYFIYPDFLHRLLTTLAAVQITYWWICTTPSLASTDVNLLFPGPRLLVLDLSYLLHLAGIVWCFLPVDRHEARRPVGYALLASMMVLALQPVVYGWFLEAGPRAVPGVAIFPWYIYIDPLMAAAAFLLVALWAVGGWRTLPAHRLACLAVVGMVAVLSVLHLGSVTLSLFLMMLGFSLQNRLVFGLGLILFPCFVSNYYYNLQLDLMEKAGVLILSGVLFLFLRRSLPHLLHQEAV